MVRIITLFRSRVFLYCLIIIVSFSVFGPATIRLPVDDQISYLAELEGSTSLIDGLALYDYGLSRKYHKGDEALFRPLLFSWLALQNTLFGYQYRHWNIANLCLHILVVLLLFELLWAITPSAFAGVFALVFSITPGTIELALWPHLGGYLLAYAFLLVALKAARAIVVNAGIGTLRNTIVYVSAMVFGVFFYELMIPASLLISGYIIWKVHRIRPHHAGYILALFLPTLAYIAAYIPHMLDAPQLFYVSGKGGSGILTIDNIANSSLRAGKLFLRWTREVLFPVFVNYSINPLRRFGKMVTWPGLSVLTTINFIIIMLGTILFWISWTKHRMKQDVSFTCLLLAISFCYCAMIAFARSPMATYQVSYYLYPFSLLIFVIAYTLTNLATLKSKYKVTIGIVLSSFFLINLYLTHGVVQDVVKANSASDAFFQKIVSFVDAHRSESDFSFNLKDHNRPEVDPVIQLRIGYPNDPKAASINMNLSTILFRKYLNMKTPLHLLDVSTITKPDDTSSSSVGD